MGFTSAYPGLVPASKTGWTFVQRNIPWFLAATYSLIEIWVYALGHNCLFLNLSIQKEFILLSLNATARNNSKQ
jgi:hypothetical protein